MLTVIIKGRLFPSFSWLHRIFVAALGLSQVVGSGGYSLIVVHRFLIAVASLVAEYRLRACGFSVEHRLSYLATYGIFRSRDQTRAPCIGKWIVNHWTTKEILEWYFDSLTWGDITIIFLVKLLRVWAHIICGLD